MVAKQTQTLELTSHHSCYPAIDPTTTLRGSAAGKTVFLAGASRGIGLATALAFAQAGAQALYLTARSEEELAQARAAVLEANPKTSCAVMVCDVTKAEQVEEAIADCVSRFGGIDVADANAGHLETWCRIGESDPANWWYSWEVNVKGAYCVARYAIPHLGESARRFASQGRSSGHLILLSSIGAQLRLEGASAYQTAKHALNRLCEFIQVDHGAEGVKCFAIHPGGVPTTLAKRMPATLHPYLVDEPELAAGFIVWLCSGEVDWAAGRYLDSTWDVNELKQMREKICGDDLLVNRLQTGAGD